MNSIDANRLIPSVAAKMSPMFDEIIRQHSDNVHSAYIVGSAVLPDYNEKLSDINSLIVLRAMDLKFITFLAPLGKKYGKKRIAAPLVMTPDYIHKSINAFPVEFLDFKLIHSTVCGMDILKDLQINKEPLRLQCEREIKVRLIGLRQGYLSAVGKKEHVAPILIRSITGSMSLFRAIIFLLGTEPPMLRTDAIAALGKTTRLEFDVFDKLLMLKAKVIKPSEQELKDLFERYYHALESIEVIIDDLHV